MKKMGTFLFFAGVMAVTGVVSATLISCGKAPSGPGASRSEAGPVATTAEETTASSNPSFGYPVAGEPWYFVNFPMAAPDVPAGLEAASWSVDRVEVDG
ncbi:MAG: hypothetical protein ACXWFO_08600, partial [Candidatus Aminicenantales bacterium]